MRGIVHGVAHLIADGFVNGIVGAVVQPSPVALRRDVWMRLREICGRDANCACSSHTRHKSGTALFGRRAADFLTSPPGRLGFALHRAAPLTRGRRAKAGRNVSPVASRGCSSAGRALQSHCRGQGFDPPQLHWCRTGVYKSASLPAAGPVGRRVPMAGVQGSGAAAYFRRFDGVIAAAPVCSGQRVSRRAVRQKQPTATDSFRGQRLRRTNRRRYWPDATGSGGWRSPGPAR
jgi:hypothetical protein